MDNLRDELPKRPVQKRYLPWVTYGLLILLLLIAQNTPRMIPALWGARPLLAVPVTLYIAMYAGPVSGAAAGVAAGLLWDVYATRLFGFNALILLVLGVAAGLLVRLLIRNNLLSALLLTIGGLLVQGLCDWLFNYVLPMRADAVFWLLHGILPNLAYTLAVSPIVYGLVRLAAYFLKKREAV